MHVHNQSSVLKFLPCCIQGFFKMRLNAVEVPETASNNTEESWKTMYMHKCIYRRAVGAVKASSAFNH